MDLLGNAKKLLHEHEKQVDEAIDQAAKLAKKHVPGDTDGAVDEAAKLAKKEL